MADDLFFLGIAGYLILGAPRLDRRPEIRAWQVPLLTASRCRMPSPPACGTPSAPSRP